MVVHGPYPLAEPRVEREARAAVDAGWEVDVIAGATTGAPRDEVCDGVRVRRLPVEHVRGGALRAIVTEYTRFTALSAAQLARRTRRYDVVHVHNPPDFLFVAALLPKVGGAATILDIHDFSPEMFSLRMGGRRIAGPAERVLRLVERGAAGVADAVVTVHEPYRHALVQRGVAPHKLVTVMNTLDERFAPVAPVRRRSGLIVSHGTITEHYGVDLLIDAVAELRPRHPGLRLELYGDGDAVPQLRARVAEHGLEDAVMIEGRYLPLPEVLEHVARAAVGVVCNRPIERNLLAVPTKLFEYVALGVPVVAADLPAVVEHFAESEITYFEAGSVHSLKAGLELVLADPRAARARARRALARYEDYRWSRNAERYVALLERLSTTRKSAATTAPVSLGSAMPRTVGAE